MPSQILIAGCASTSLSDFAVAVRTGLSPGNVENLSALDFDKNLTKCTAQITTKYYSAPTEIVRLLTKLDGTLVECKKLSDVQACVLFVELSSRDKPVLWAETVVAGLEAHLSGTTVTEAAHETAPTQSGEALSASDVDVCGNQQLKDCGEQLCAAAEDPRVEFGVPQRLGSDLSSIGEVDDNAALGAVPIKLLVVRELADAHNDTAGKTMECIGGWCFDNEFELVHIAGESADWRVTAMGDRGRAGKRGLLNCEDDTCSGISRVIEALQTHMWPGMQLMNDNDGIAADSCIASSTVTLHDSISGADPNQPTKFKMDKEMENLDKIERLVGEMQQVREKTLTLQGKSCDEERRHLASNTMAKLLEVLGSDVEDG